MRFTNVALINTIITIYLCLLTVRPVIARPWYYPAYNGKDIVNPYLTPERALATPKAIWNGQLVLWEGTVVAQERLNLPKIVLKSNGLSIPVHFMRPAQNTERDIVGYKVAIKGYVEIKHGKFQKLCGMSTILLCPPPSQSLPLWSKKTNNNLSDYLAWRVSFHQPDMSRNLALSIGKELVDSAQHQGLDPLIFAALIQIESAFNPKAISSSEAIGLGQLKMSTARGLHVKDPFDPIQNLRGSARMLGNLQNQWKNAPNICATMLASYNAGPTCLKERNGAIPPYTETNNYIYFIGRLQEKLQNQVNYLLGDSNLPIDDTL